MFKMNITRQLSVVFRHNDYILTMCNTGRKSIMRHICLSSSKNAGVTFYTLQNRSYSMETQEKLGHSKITVDEKEMKQFNKFGESWWNETGELAPLHAFNEIRIPWIRDTLMENHESQTIRSKVKPLKGLDIVDVGCGGGILSEPLARLGANVLGIDAEVEGTKVAEFHKQQDPSFGDELQYQHTTVEDLAACTDNQAAYDAVVASEVVEHVIEQSIFVENCCKLVKPGGSIFFTTLNKTTLSYWLAVFGAENVLRIVPSGTHDHDKFLRPEDLQHLLDENGFSTRLIHGLWMNPLTYKWSWKRGTEINYALHAIKTYDA